MSESDQNKNKQWSPFLIYMTGIVGLVYLLNPTAGFIELIPDNLPIVGNLDEGAAAVLVWNTLRQIRSLRKSS